MNIAFMGSPETSKDILEHIYNEGLNISLVVSKEDTIRGRGKKKTQTPVKSFAIEKNIPVLTPKKIDKEFIFEFKKYDIDIALVVAYGKILPKSFLKIPKYGCINIHYSLLPKYRGASPVESAILNGEDESGVSFIKMNEKMDEGDIVFMNPFPILENNKTEDVFEKANEISKANIINVLENIKNNKVEFEKQNEDEATYCGMFTKEMTVLDFNEKLNTLHNKVRAFSMGLGTKTDVLGFNVKIWETRKICKNDEEYNNIKNLLEKKYKEDIIKLPLKTIVIYNKCLYIYVSDGFLKILVIQPENKGRMKISDFLNGYASKINTKCVKNL